ncbi:transposase [Streptomyces sp. NPDC021093]|uniref:transposase n=1 Tax=Streptomyces sp. NPDC021093 TaxID=3365112 RepID=UPI0037A2B3AE
MRTEGQTKARCTCSKTGGRFLSRQPRDREEALDHARAQQTDEQRRDKYAARAGVEGTIHQPVAATGMRYARYLGLRRTHPEHVFTAGVLNLIRLDNWWSGHPWDHTRHTASCRHDYCSSEVRDRR